MRSPTQRLGHEKFVDQYFPRHVLRITAIPCVRQGQRLAVVKVMFEDGALWQLPTRFPADTPK